MNVWERLPIKAGGGGLWKALASDLAEPASLDGGPGVWAAIGTRPGGLWRGVAGETLLVPRQRPDLWQQSARETQVLPRAALLDVWQALAADLGRRARGGDASGLWGQVRDETRLIDRAATPIWSQAGARDMAQRRPARAPGWAVKKLQAAGGDTYYVLKSLRSDAYLRLDERQLYVWNLLDGDHSIQDVAVACFVEYRSLSIDWLLGYLGQLQDKGFLSTEPVDVYRQAGRQLERADLGTWAARAVGWLIQSQIWINGIDTFFGGLYRLGGRLLFLWPAQVLILLVSAAGLPAYAILTQRGDLSVLTGTAGSGLTAGLVGLLLAELLAVLLHESAHALTTKHYGRVVRRGGFGLYFGMPSVFMDTTDVWMEPRRHRLAVTWAGPYSGFFLGGLAGLVLLASPPDIWAGLLYQFATFCYGISILNLNPLLKLDGYYMLMDWLEMPRLRERSTQFVRRQLWGKLRRREPFSRDDGVFAVFGALALAWTASVLFSMARLYGRALFALVEALAGTAAAWAVLGALLALLAFNKIRRLRTRRGSRAAGDSKGDSTGWQ